METTLLDMQHLPDHRLRWSLIALIEGYHFPDMFSAP